MRIENLPLKLLHNSVGKPIKGTKHGKISKRNEI